MKFPWKHEGEPVVGAGGFFFFVFHPREQSSVNPSTNFPEMPQMSTLRIEAKAIGEGKKFFSLPFYVLLTGLEIKLIRDRFTEEKTN